VSDLLWNDPVHNQNERNALGQGGFPKMFGPNARGSECATFGEEAVTEFMQRTGVTYIIRAHEKYSLGFGADVGGRVLTVFSSSNYSGSNNQAGMILVSVFISVLSISHSISLSGTGRSTARDSDKKGVK
jgi:hypothetical protein